MAEILRHFTKNHLKNTIIKTYNFSLLQYRHHRLIRVTVHHF